MNAMRKSRDTYLKKESDGWIKSFDKDSNGAQDKESTNRRQFLTRENEKCLREPAKHGKNLNRRTFWIVREIARVHSTRLENVGKQQEKDEDIDEEKNDEKRIIIVREEHREKKTKDQDSQSE